MMTGLLSPAAQYSLVGPIKPRPQPDNNLSIAATAVRYRVFKIGKSLRKQGKYTVSYGRDESTKRKSVARRITLSGSLLIVEA
jgi:hypothetical protein